MTKLILTGLRSLRARCWAHAIRARHVCLLMLVVLLLQQAGEARSADTEIETARKALAAGTKQAKYACRGAIAALPMKYLAALEALQKTLQCNGDLDGLLVVAREATRFRTSRKLTPASLVQVPEVLRKLQVQYLRAPLEAQSAKRSRIERLTQDYANQLEELKIRLTQVGRIEDAIRVREEIQRLEKSRPQSIPFKRCVAFRKDGDCVGLNMPAAALDGDGATYLAWVFPANDSHSGLLFWDGNDRLQMDRQISFDRGHITVYLHFNPRLHLKSTVRIPPRRWSHVAVVLDGSACRIYVNGRLCGTHQGPIASHRGSSAVFLGRGRYQNRPWATQYFGCLAGVGLWNHPLNAREIVNASRGDLVAPDKCLGFWDFSRDMSSSAGLRTRGTLFSSPSIIPVEAARASGAAASGGAASREGSGNGGFVGEWQDAAGFMSLHLRENRKGFLLLFRDGGGRGRADAGGIAWQTTGNSISFLGEVGMGTGNLSADAKRLTITVEGVRRVLLQQ